MWFIDLWIFCSCVSAIYTFGAVYVWYTYLFPIDRLQTVEAYNNMFREMITWPAKFFRSLPKIR